MGSTSIWPPSGTCRPLDRSWRVNSGRSRRPGQSGRGDGGVRTRARIRTGRGHGQALPGDRPGDAEHRPERSCDHRWEGRAVAHRPASVPGGHRRRGSDRDDLERDLPGPRFQAGTVVTEDPVAASPRSRVHGSHDHRRAGRCGRDRGAVRCPRSPASPRRPGSICCFSPGARSRAPPLSSGWWRLPTRVASRLPRCERATTGSSS